ncbi:MAG: PAS domain-containing protein [Candidatus Omnitrophota bacterium]
MKKVDRPPRLSLRNNIIIGFCCLIVIWDVIIVNITVHVLRGTLIRQGIQAGIIEDILRRFILVGNGSIFMGAILAAGIGWIFAKAITRPVRALTRAMTEVSPGSLPVEIKANFNAGDEYGRLMEAYNAMVRQSALSRKHIEENRNNLERLVAQRTTELTRINHDLEKAVNELQKEKGFSKVISENIEDSLMLLSPDFKIIWANKSAREMIGGDEGAILGRYCYEATHHLSECCPPPHDECPVLEVLKTGLPATYVHTHFGDDGKEAYVEASAYPVKDKSGNVVQLVYVTRDITQKAAMLKNLSRKVNSLERFNKLAVDREMKMMELKRRIRELEEKAGK